MFIESNPSNDLYMQEGRKHFLSLLHFVLFCLFLVLMSRLGKALFLLAVPTELPTDDITAALLLGSEVGLQQIEWR